MLYVACAPDARCAKDHGIADMPSAVYVSAMMLTGQASPEGDMDAPLRGVVLLTAFLSVPFFAVPAAMLTWGFEGEAQVALQPLHVEGCSLCLCTLKHASGELAGVACLLAATCNCCYCPKTAASHPDYAESLSAVHPPPPPPPPPPPARAPPPVSHRPPSLLPSSASPPSISSHALITIHPTTRAALGNFRARADDAA